MVRYIRGENLNRPPKIIQKLFKQLMRIEAYIVQGSGENPKVCVNLQTDVK